MKFLNFLMGLSLLVVFYQYEFRKYEARGRGWDMGIYCSAIASMDKNLDPYYVANTKTSLSYSYPPFAAKFFSPFCNNSINYRWLMFLILILGSTLIAQTFKLPLWFCAANFLYGLKTTIWNFETENTGVLEFSVLTIGVLLFRSKNKSWTMIFGFLGYLKIVPIIGVFADPTFFKKWGKNSLRLVFLPSAVLGALYLLDFTFFPEYVSSYWKSVLGLIPNQHAASKELVGDLWNPTPILYLKNYTTGTIQFVAIYLAVLAFSAGLLHFLFRKFVNPVDQLALSLFILFYLSPRLKPYSYFYVILPITLLGVGLSGWQLMLISGLLVIPHFFQFGILEHGLQAICALSAFGLTLFFKSSKLIGRLE